MTKLNDKMVAHEEPESAVTLTTQGANGGGGKSDDSYKLNK